jgi:small nuclear ribonucleoprotein (snRNP)-like protein
METTSNTTVGGKLDGMDGFINIKIRSVCDITPPGGISSSQTAFICADVR